MIPDFSAGDDTYPLLERRAAPRTWTLQTITAAISVAATIIAGGWSVASLVQARLNDITDKLAVLQQENILLRERVAYHVAELAKFQGAGERFTMEHGNKLNARVDRLESRISIIEQRQAVYEDRGNRK